MDAAISATQATHIIHLSRNKNFKMIDTPTFFYSWHLMECKKTIIIATFAALEALGSAQLWVESMIDPYWVTHVQKVSHSLQWKIITPSPGKAYDWTCMWKYTSIRPAETKAHPDKLGTRTRTVCKPTKETSTDKAVLLKQRYYPPKYSEWLNRLCWEHTHSVQQRTS